MTYPRYPAYKPSGGAWLGEIPAHWEATKLAQHLSNIETGWTPEAEQRIAEETEWAVVKVGCVRDGKFLEEEHKALAPHLTAPPDLEVKPGDLLMSRANTVQLVGSVGLVRQTRPYLTLCDKTFRLILGQTLLPEYANFSLQSRTARYQIELAASGASASMKNISQDSVRAIVVPTPPLPEQTAIAAFLDRETAQIDALVARQERLIALLQEKRQALISWIVGRISEGIDTKLKYHVDLLSGYAFSSADFISEPESLRLMRGVNISPGAVRWDDTVYCSGSDESIIQTYSLQRGDIVFGMDRPWISGGLRVAEVSEADIPSLLVQRVARLRTRSGMTQPYLKLILESSEYRGYFEPLFTGVSVPHVSAEQILAFRFRLPDTDIQEGACRRFEDEECRIIRIRALLERSIACLRERRAALIAAAVTGKIDVRGL